MIDKNTQGILGFLKKFWIGVACKEHVENGVKLGICQFYHGRSSPSKRLSRGDFVIYYSSKITIEKSDLYQKFTAIGKVMDDEQHQTDMGDNFKPFRRNIDYFDAKHIDIKPLISSLPHHKQNILGLCFSVWLF